MIKRALLASFLVVPFTIFYTFITIHSAQAATSDCVIVNVNIQGVPKNLPPNCQNSGGVIPSADRAALLAKIKTYTNQDKINFQTISENDRIGLTNGTGMVRRKDGQMMSVSTEILRIIVYLVEQGYSLNISCIYGTHNRESASGNVSRHWTGYGIDLSVTQGTNTTKPAVMKLMKTLNALAGKELAPQQVLCAGIGRNDPDIDALSMNGGKISPGYTAAQVRNHVDHIHIGY